MENFFTIGNSQCAAARLLLPEFASGGRDVQAYAQQCGPLATLLWADLFRVGLTDDLEILSSPNICRVDLWVFWRILLAQHVINVGRLYEVRPLEL